MRRALLLGLLAFLSEPISLASQNIAQTPRTRVSTHLVQIDVTVRRGNDPVQDLTQDDFEVLDRGKPRKVSVFSVQPQSTTHEYVQPLAANTFSDLPQYVSGNPGSVTIVLLDNLNTLSGSAPQAYETTPYWLEDHALANGKQHLREFLRQMDTKDRVAIYGLTSSLHVLCDFTCDRDQLLAVVEKYDPTSRTQRESVEPGSYHFPSPGGGFDESVDADVQFLAELKNDTRSEITISALTAIAAHVADIPGRKNLLWLTANLPFSGEFIARILIPANIAAYPLDARGLLPRGAVAEGESFGVVGRMLQIDSGPAESDQPIGLNTMQTLADLTGGRAFINANDITGAIKKAVEDSAVTYTLGFYIESSALDGKFHELKVRVKESGLNVRCAKGYFASKDAPATRDERRGNLVSAIKSPLEWSGIPLKVSVDLVKEPAPGSMTLSGLVDIHDVRLVENGPVREGALDIALVEQDETGKVLRESANRIDLRVSEKRYSAFLKTGISFRKSIRPQAGTTIMRVLVQDPATAMIGSLIIPLSRLR